jgi:hypothetical protein
MDVGEIGWGGMDWIGLAQDKDKWRALCDCGKEPPEPIKGWEVLQWLHNWWPTK